MKTTEPGCTSVPELRHVQALARYAYETACAVLPNPSLGWDATPLAERCDLIGYVIARATGVVYDHVYGHPVNPELLPYVPEWRCVFDAVVDALGPFVGSDWTTFEQARQLHANKEPMSAINQRHLGTNLHALVEFAMSRDFRVADRDGHSWYVRLEDILANKPGMPQSCGDIEVDARFDELTHLLREHVDEHPLDFARRLLNAREEHTIKDPISYDAAHPDDCRVFVAPPAIDAHGGHGFADEGAFVALGMFAEFNLHEHPPYGDPLGPTGSWNISRVVVDEGAWLKRFDGTVELRVQLCARDHTVLRDTWLTRVQRTTHVTRVQAGESIVLETLSGTYLEARPWAERAAVVAEAKRGE